MLCGGRKTAHCRRHTCYGRWRRLNDPERPGPKVSNETRVVGEPTAFMARDRSVRRTYNTHVAVAYSRTAVTVCVCVCMVTLTRNRNSAISRRTERGKYLPRLRRINVRITTTTTTTMVTVPRRSRNVVGENYLELIMPRVPRWSPDANVTVRHTAPVRLGFFVRVFLPR